MTIQTFVFQMKASFSTKNYLADYFSEKVEVSNSKFERVIFHLLNFVYTKNN